jgi:hypothetical protein
MTFIEWWEIRKKELSGLTITDWDYTMAEAAWNARGYNLQTQGHDEPCFYCKERCDGYAGNPDKWPLIFCHPDGTGKPHVHHTGCVVERLFSSHET